MYDHIKMVTFRRRNWNVGHEDVASWNYSTGSQPIFKPDPLGEKQKDGVTRWICVDYHKLNQVIIADKFPIHYWGVTRWITQGNSLFQVRFVLKVSLNENEGERHRKGDVLYLRRALWVPCYAVWFNQCPYHILVPNESSISTVLEAIFIGVFYDILVYITDIKEHKRHPGVVFAILRGKKLFANQKKWVIRHFMIQ